MEESADGPPAVAPEPVPGNPAIPTRLAARWTPHLVAAVLLGGAGWMLRRALASSDYRALRAAIHAVPSAWMLRALALTALSYFALFGYDALALRHVGRPVGWRRTALTSFLAYAFSQSLGMSALTGASIRFRFWSMWGLSAGEIAQGVAFTTLSFWLGVSLIGGVALMADPVPAHALPLLPLGIPRAIGFLLVVPVAAYLAWAASGRGRITIRGWTFRPASAPMALLQALVSTVDWTLAALVLAVLLPHAAGLTVPRLVGFYVVAQVVALASHVPGGLGVFEAVMLVLLRPFLPAPVVVAALVAYRAIYYLVPLGVATIVFAAFEATTRQDAVGKVARTIGRVVPAAAPWWLSGATFAAGVVLLLSGSTPSVHARVRWLDALLPLAVIEVSHFTASVTGIVLILVANGLRRRLDAAYHLAVIALGIGIATSLLKGVDYEEALILSVVLLALLPARRHFYRRAALLGEPLSPGWIAAIVLAVAGATALGAFAFQHVDYSVDLWWRFATVADAPRFLRAMVGVSVVLMAYAVARLLRPTAASPAPPSSRELDRARLVARKAQVAEAHLALLGDKSLLFSASDASFLMYGVRGRSWIALGDPVGLPGEAAELAWRFKGLADQHGGRAVFYQVSREHLPLYIDLGLTLIKIGEEARVPLPSFTLDGKSRKSLRRTLRDVEAMGASLEVVPPDEVPAILPELRRVSDDWLGRRNTREKGFSLGYFDDAYLRECAVAVVRRSGRIVAFANLWMSGGREEISVDLMRYCADAPPSVMDYLFGALMQRARDDGWQWFNLGMAPLAGLDPRALAPAWSRIGAMVFSHGEHFYNFRGLRQYKDKFDPVWVPRYLAGPGGLAVPTILLDVTALVSRGLRGALTR
jgi:phosphatidylglycerol lysyltransferase